MAVAMAAVLGKTNPKLACDAIKRFRHRRDMANRLRRFNRGLLVTDDELKSIARCGNALGNLVMIRRHRDGNMRPTGVATCKSVWGCLGCAARKRAEKSALVQWYVDRHFDAGKAVSFASFTLAHYRADELAVLLEGLRKAFTDMRNLKVYKDAVDRYGIDGWIAALEITDGKNGWHPHLHVLFFHEEFLPVEYGENADLKGALHEAFSRQIDRHLGRAVHQIHGVDLVPVKTAGGDDGALARYLGKIQLEMTRQDLKDARHTTSRSPWQIGLDAADTGNKQDTARWVEYLKATKGRNVVTRSQSLADIYGEPTDEEINDMLGIEPENDDDQADDHDEGENIASLDAAVWNDTRTAITADGRSVTAVALTALEDRGPTAMAEVLTSYSEPIEVVTHPETGLPHLRYMNRRDTVTVTSGSADGQHEPVNLDELGPVARAWYGHTRPDNR